MLTGSSRDLRHQEGHPDVGTWTPRFRLRFLTKVSRVVVGGAVESKLPEVRNQSGDPSSVDTLTLTQHIELRHEKMSSKMATSTGARSPTRPERPRPTGERLQLSCARSPLETPPPASLTIRDLQLAVSVHVCATRSDLVEELEELCAGLMDGADDGSPPPRQSFEQRHHLETRRAVQTAETQKQETPAEPAERRRRRRQGRRRQGRARNATSHLPASAPGWLIEEHDRRIIDQFQSDGQPLHLPPRQAARSGVCTVQQTQSHQDLLDLNTHTHQSCNLSEQNRKWSGLNLTIFLRAALFSCSFRLAETCRKQVTQQKCYTNTADAKLG